MGVTEADPRERAFVLFASLWAAATLFHIGSFNQWREHVVLAVAAAWVLCRPGSVAALLMLALLQIERAVAFAPYISNHWLFTSLINAGLLLSALFVMFKHRRLTVDRLELFATFAAAGRLALIVLYFFVVFHKLKRHLGFDANVCNLEEDRIAGARAFRVDVFQVARVD